MYTHTCVEVVQQACMLNSSCALDHFAVVATSVRHEALKSELA